MYSKTISALIFYLFLGGGGVGGGVGVGVVVGTYSILGAY